MKHSIILLLCIAFILSCQKEVSRDYAIVAGTVSNGPGKVNLGTLDRSFTMTMPTDANGTFRDIISSDFGHFMFFDGKNFTPVYIEKGDSIHISYDANDFNNSLTFAGDGAPISDYLKNKSTLERELRGPENVYTLDETTFKTTFTGIRDSLLANLDATAGIPESYKIKETRNINYSYLGQLMRYQPYHAYYTGNPDFEVSEDFLKELDQIDYNNEDDFKFSNAYANLVTGHYNNKAQELIESDSLADYAALHKAISVATSELIKNKLLFNSAKTGITYTDDLEGYYTSFMTHSTNEEHKTEITATYDKLKVLSKGSPSPKFTDYENYAGGTTSLSDLEGKYVYIDVWATWCGPCKREIPFLKEVEAKYHDKNIAFVSISIDKVSDHEKWKTMVEEKELGGIQLFADNDWNSAFVKEYQIQGIPRFILINPEGQIINANAPRPSDPKLIELFTEYNI
ncbi:TlpA family protein disulfide reductase [Aestuariivivens sediminicola]|uniref:TlpA family protein disulfide reductase n=1 Tax=Aestuariivivens sediminicola TaxID=2913560 RepID=UPI001F58726A|nr:TlpA disulfide reductase family protein [Aestuariivivens sediminicola]